MARLAPALHCRAGIVEDIAQSRLVRLGCRPPQIGCGSRRLWRSFDAALTPFWRYPPQVQGTSPIPEGQPWKNPILTEKSRGVDKWRGFWQVCPEK